MVRTSKKLVELYLEWRMYTFPEWARSRGKPIDGITTQDPAKRAAFLKEGRQLLKELSSKHNPSKASDIDVDIRLCLDDCKAACEQLDRGDLSIREIIDLVAPDNDEQPWREAERWLEASEAMPRALARAQASGPWVKEQLLRVAAELDAVSRSAKDPTRRTAAHRAQLACEHLANSVGYRPTVKHHKTFSEQTWRTAKDSVTRDSEALLRALHALMPNRTGYEAFNSLLQPITERGRALGLVEGWSQSLKTAVETIGWAMIPSHAAPTVGIMQESRSYSSAQLRSSDPIASSTVLIKLPLPGLTAPFTVAHETYPGHLLQCLYQAKSPSTAMRLIGPSTPKEGWACYAESRMCDFNLLDPHLVKVAAAHRRVLRSCRLVSRLALSSGRGTVESAKSLFERIALLTSEAAAREASRVQWDDKAIDYTLGHNAIEMLENEYVSRGRGDAISFRNQLLPLLAMPLDLAAIRMGMGYLKILTPENL